LEPCIGRSAVRCRLSAISARRQLAHKERKKARASYNQAEYLGERRAMMQQWADMVDSMAQGGNVTSIKRTVV
jgi:hypothetical protein